MAFNCDYCNCKRHRYTCGRKLGNFFESFFHKLPPKVGMSNCEGIATKKKDNHFVVHQIVFILGTNQKRYAISGLQGRFTFQIAK